MTLGRRSLVDSSPLQRQTDRDQGAFAKYLNKHVEATHSKNEEIDAKIPPTPNNTPVKSKNTNFSTYRPARAAAKSTNLNKRLDDHL